MAPDFVVELQKATDSLRVTQQKMHEYIACGVRLAWLIDLPNQQVEIYRQEQDVEVLRSPDKLVD